MQHTARLHPSAADASTVGSRVTHVAIPLYTLVLASGLDSHEVSISDAATAREYFAAIEAAAHELVIAANAALSPAAVA